MKLLIILLFISTVAWWSTAQFAPAKIFTGLPRKNEGFSTDFEPGTYSDWARAGVYTYSMEQYSMAMVPENAFVENGRANLRLEPKFTAKDLLGKIINMDIASGEIMTNFAMGYGTNYYFGFSTDRRQSLHPDLPLPFFVLFLLWTISTKKGCFEGRLKTNRKSESGTVTSFYTFTNVFDTTKPADQASSQVWNEIDFELIGSKPFSVHLNIFKNGVAVAPADINLREIYPQKFSNFDHRNFHNYVIKWTSDGITW